MKTISLLTLLVTLVSCQTPQKIETTPQENKSINALKTALIEYHTSPSENAVITAKKLNSLIKNHDSETMMLLAILNFKEGYNIDSLYWFRQAALHGHYGGMSFLCMLAQDKSAPYRIYIDGQSWCSIAKERSPYKYLSLSKEIQNLESKLQNKEINKKYIENKSKIKELANNNEEINWKLIEISLQINNKLLLENLDKHEADAFPVFAFIAKDSTNDEAVYGIISTTGYNMDKSITDELLKNIFYALQESNPQKRKVNISKAYLSSTANTVNKLGLSIKVHDYYKP